MAFLRELMGRGAQAFAAGYSDGTLLAVNDAFCRLTGCGRDELSSTTWALDLTPPEWREPEAGILAEMHRTGEAQRYEKECMRKDGSRITVEIIAHEKCNDAGEIDFLFGFMTVVLKLRGLNCTAI